jgi:hypothetical protein
MDIQKCVRYQQKLSDIYKVPVNQEYVSKLYKKLFGKDMKKWIKPFYTKDDGSSQAEEKMYEVLRNVQKYI